MTNQNRNYETPGNSQELPFYGSTVASSPIMQQMQMELSMLLRRQRTCRIWGVLAAIAFCVYYISYLTEGSSPNSQNMAATVFAIILFGLFCYCVPFGICTVWRWIQKSGFFISGSGIVLLFALFVIPVMIAGIIAPFIPFYMRYKIGATRKAIENAAAPIAFTQ